MAKLVRLPGVAARPCGLEHVVGDHEMAQQRRLRRLVPQPLHLGPRRPPHLAEPVGARPLDDQIELQLVVMMVDLQPRPRDHTSGATHQTARDVLRPLDRRFSFQFCKKR